MTDRILFHLNAVLPRTPINWDVPEVRVFASRLPAVFAAADRCEGLLWHEHGVRRDSGECTPFTPSQRSFPDLEPHILTLAAWRSFKDLHDFTYHWPAHLEAMQRLRHWADRSHGASLVIWWGEPDARPSLEEGWDKLRQLREYGPSPSAFSFRERYGADGRRAEQRPAA